jgi:DNA polymerase
MNKQERFLDYKKRVFACKDCPLWETRTNVVIGDGNIDAKIVLVGEGPGENEDLQGRPFVGRAGKLLEEVLLENGLTREEVWITNIIRCRATIREEGSVRNRPPRPQEVQACKKWLEEELSIVKPKVIVCLGAPSAEVIIHKGFRMTEERGRWFKSVYAPFAIATYHPAYVLRQPGRAFDELRWMLSEDIAEARRRAESLQEEEIEERVIIPPAEEGGEQLNLF